MVLQPWAASQTQGSRGGSMANPVRVEKQRHETPNTASPRGADLPPSRRRSTRTATTGSTTSTRQQRWIRHQPRPHRQAEARGLQHGVTQGVSLPPSRKRSTGAATMGSTTSTKQQGWVRHQPRPHRRAEARGSDKASPGRAVFEQDAKNEQVLQPWAAPQAQDSWGDP